MKHTLSIVFVAAILGLIRALPAAETVRLPATADIWLSDANGSERASSSGKADRLKLKVIQEMAAIRFDVARARGREVLGARLFLRRAGDDMLRYIRLSTVNQDWVEGNTAQAYGKADGATYQFADAATKKPWSWPGSEFCDVVMSCGQTIDAYAERKELKDGWISVDVAPALIYALVAGDSDGLCVMDGGTILLHNNFVYSCQSKGNEPYLEVDLGAGLAKAPAAPQFTAEPAPQRASLTGGAIKLTFAQTTDAICWKIKLDGNPLDRWQVHHPNAKGATTFYLTDLKPGAAVQLEAVAIGRGGAASAPTTVRANTSPSLPHPPALAKLDAPKAAGSPPEIAGKLRVFAYPSMVKIGPDRAEATFGEEKTQAPIAQCNAVWNGKEILLHGGRGEYVSFQLCLENLGPAALNGLAIAPEELTGPGGAKIASDNIELYKNWYAKNHAGRWQSAYAVPLKTGTALAIPDPARLGKAGFDQQTNQSITVDLYVPKDAKPGDYAGAIAITLGTDSIHLPIKLSVGAFGIPNTLSFWPELNGYRYPKNAIDYYRLAHKYRCVLNTLAPAPRLQGKGKDIQVLWDTYDTEIGPLLSGEAFKDNRRPGVPLECMYLPFADGWPTQLTKETYRYDGPWYRTTSGAKDYQEGLKAINENYLTAPYIGDALSSDYKDAWLSVQRQFVDHFKAKGWNRTQMQCFYGGKKTHRIDYGVEQMWWTTDEPMYWDDWLALQFFDRMWRQGRDALQADPKIWVARGDISRPNWQGRVLENAIDVQYGGFGGPANVQRLHTLRDETGVRINNYGGANDDASANTGSVSILLGVYLNGGNAHLPWQSLGGDAALDTNDAGADGGNALLVDGHRFGLPVVGDLRLVALREAQQLIEYLELVGKKKDLNRQQLREMVLEVMPFEAGRKKGANADNADAMAFTTLQAWQIDRLRTRLAELLAN